MIRVIKWVNCFKRGTNTKDVVKLNVAREKGFDILIVWDSEYRKDKKETIKKCLNFLKT